VCVHDKLSPSKDNGDIANILNDILNENRVIRKELKNLKVTNINVFLNDRCRDAMNLTDFIDNIKMSVEDLEYSGKYGYVKGVSQIFMKNLTRIEPCHRPLHCSDIKRLKFYVRDNNMWDRDTGNMKLDNSINHISKRQHKILKEWENQNPKYENDNVKLEKYFNIVRSIIHGCDAEEILQNKSKIIRNVSNGINIKELIKL